MTRPRASRGSFSSSRAALRRNSIPYRPATFPPSPRYYRLRRMRTSSRDSRCAFAGSASASRAAARSSSSSSASRSSTSPTGTTAASSRPRRTTRTRSPAYATRLTSSAKSSRASLTLIVVATSVSTCTSRTKRTVNVSRCQARQDHGADIRGLRAAIQPRSAMFELVGLYGRPRTTSIPARTLVSGTQTTVRIALRLNASDWTTTTGRRKPGADPAGSDRSAHQTSPWAITNRLTPSFGRPQHLRMDR